MAYMSLVDELFKTSPSLLDEILMEADAVTDCVDSQSSLKQEMNEDRRPSRERKQAPLHEEQINSADKSDDSDSTVASAFGEKHRAKKIRLKNEQLDLQCEWRDCDYRTCNLGHFVSHVSLHIPHLEVKVAEDQEGIGSIVFPRILHTSSSTWQCNLSNHLLVHINFH
jgi:hypothetical protein